MIKGCQKRIFFVKNTGCDLLDEAYFVLKDDVPVNDELNASIVQIATEVINQSGLPPRRKKSRKAILSFFSGCFLGAIISVIIFLAIF